MSWSIKIRFRYILFFILLLTGSTFGKVYVYEVVTKDTTFYTASKLIPASFLFYNGGEDIIYSLKVVKSYGDDEFDKAIKDFNLEDKNVRTLPHTPISPHISRLPYYWWR